jgi:hypothetical protein
MRELKRTRPAKPHKTSEATQDQQSRTRPAKPHKTGEAEKKLSIINYPLSIINRPIPFTLSLPPLQRK